MNNAFFQIWNTHAVACGKPPSVTNQSKNQYCGYYQNRHGNQWVFVYDSERKVGQPRGGDASWDTVLPVKDGRVEMTLDDDEAAWLRLCWDAATFTVSVN